MNDLNKEKLEELKRLCKEIKDEIQYIHNIDSANPKDDTHRALYVKLSEIEYDILPKL